MSWGMGFSAQFRDVRILSVTEPAFIVRPGESKKLIGAFGLVDLND
ncbi:MAG: hypothetical protein RBR77_10505 [Thauera sp.]|jgi:hypothetical protein|nr:hypothetical protein [Thauera sp.]